MSTHEMDHPVDDEELWDEYQAVDDDEEWPDDLYIEDQTVEPTEVLTDDIDPELVEAVDSIRPCWRDAVAQHVATHGQCDPAEFPAGSGSLARIGRGAGLGRYEEREKEKGKTYQHWVRITKWVGYRERQRTTHTIGADHQLGQTGVIVHTVVLFGERGRRWEIHDVRSETSASARMVDRAGADLEVPYEPMYLPFRTSASRYLANYKPVVRRLRGAGSRCFPRSGALSLACPRFSLRAR